MKSSAGHSPEGVSMIHVVTSCSSILSSAHIIEGKAHSWPLCCCCGGRITCVWDREEEAKHGSRQSRWCLRYREGSRLYVTHFLHRIPRLYCISTRCFFVSGTNSCWQSSQFISMLSTQRTETNCTGNETLLWLFIWLLLLMGVLILWLLPLLLHNTDYWNWSWPVNAAHAASSETVKLLFSFENRYLQIFYCLFIISIFFLFCSTYFVFSLFILIVTVYYY